MKIGVDIDGVISDFAERIEAYAKWVNMTEYKKSIKEDTNGRTFANDEYNWTKEEYFKFFDDYEVKVSKTASIMPLCKEIMTILSEEGNKIYILTARDSYNGEMITIAKDMLDMNHIPYDEIFFNMPHKTEKCKQLGLDYMIEDNLKTCLSLEKEKIKSLYFRNRGYIDFKDTEYIHTVNNWPEIYEYLKSNYKIIEESEYR